MKLSQWARKNGLTYKTAWTLFNNGNLPVKAVRLNTGTILIQEDDATSVGKTVLYSRVSSHGQKADAERQLSRLRDFCSAKGIVVSAELTEIGSGLNGNRKKLLTILNDNTVTTIVVEHRDRLVRFGFDFIQASLAAHKRNIMVVNNTECPDDIVRDMTEVLTSMCARLYGKRGAKNRAKKAIDLVSK